MPQITIKIAIHAEKAITLELERGGDTTVGEVKRKIHDAQGFLSNEQRLVFPRDKPRSWDLDDGRILTDCGLTFGDGDAAMGHVYWDYQVEIATGRTSTANNSHEK